MKTITRKWQEYVRHTPPNSKANQPCGSPCIAPATVWAVVKIGQAWVIVPVIVRPLEYFILDSIFCHRPNMIA